MEGAVTPSIRLWRSRTWPLVVVLAACLGSGCRLADVPLWGPANPPPGTALPTEQVRGIVYHRGPDADDRHQLDLWRPRGRTNCPVVLLIHGGVWMVGDNRCCGLYASVGEFLARQGIVAVLPCYRLSPAVKHPEHVRDVARAFAWVRQNVAQYGGRADQVFLLGHSAGGHLVSLLATDETYLKGVGLRTADVQGVVTVSGVYRVPGGTVAATLGGAGPRAFHLDEVMPVRGGGAWSLSRLLGGAGIPVYVDVFGPAFGDDPWVRQQASPLAHVRPGLPPFLILHADSDLPTLPEMAAEFHRALSAQGCSSSLLRVEQRNHNSILFRAIEPNDPAARAVLDFVRRHGTPQGPAAAHQVP
jgi:acetyl esterase/lipase